MAFDAPAFALGSAARTTPGNFGPVELKSPARTVTFHVNVTAANGTLSLSVEWSQDGGASWAKGDPADAFTDITATGAVVKQFTVKGPLFRFVWGIAGGGASFTFGATSYLT